jgi:hypothetical protein
VQVLPTPSVQPFSLRISRHTYNALPLEILAHGALARLLAVQERSGPARGLRVPGRDVRRDGAPGEEPDLHGGGQDLGGVDATARGVERVPVREGRGRVAAAITVIIN